MSCIDCSADFSQTGNWKKGWNRLFLIISWCSESQQVAIDCNIHRSVIQVVLILFQIHMICSAWNFWDQWTCKCLETHMLCRSVNLLICQCYRIYRSSALGIFIKSELCWKCSKFYVQFCLGMLLPFSRYRERPTFFHVVSSLKHSSLSIQTVLFFNWTN